MFSRKSSASSALKARFCTDDEVRALARRVRIAVRERAAMVVEESADALRRSGGCHETDVEETRASQKENLRHDAEV